MKYPLMFYTEGGGGVAWWLWDIDIGSDHRPTHKVVPVDAVVIERDDNGNLRVNGQQARRSSAMALLVSEVVEWASGIKEQHDANS